jgi:hypothetical protein
MFDTSVLWIRKAKAEAYNGNANMGSRGVAVILISII